MVGGKTRFPLRISSNIRDRPELWPQIDVRDDNGDPVLSLSGTPSLAYTTMWLTRGSALFTDPPGSDNRVRKPRLPVTAKLYPVVIWDNNNNITLGEITELPDYVTEEYPYNFVTDGDFYDGQPAVQSGMVFRYGPYGEYAAVDVEAESGPGATFDISSSGVRGSDGQFVEDEAMRAGMGVLTLTPGQGRTRGFQPGTTEVFQAPRIVVASGGIAGTGALPRPAADPFEGVGKKVWALKLDSAGANYTDIVDPSGFPTDENVRLTATWLMRWDADFSPFYVLVDGDGEQWNVVTVREVGRRRFIQVDVTRDIPDPRRAEG